MGQAALEVAQPVLIIGDQALAVDHVDARASLLLGEPLGLHGHHHHLGDAAAGGARPHEHHPLLGDALVASLAGRHQGAYHHRGGTLDVVVEAAQLVAVTRQQRHRVGLGEVLELQQHAGPAALHRGDELREEGVVLFLGDARMPPAHVHGVVQQRLVVGAHVQHDRLGVGGTDAATGGVERKLADGNPHAADALVAKPQDALAVGDHDHLHLVLGGGAQDVIHAVAVAVVDEQPAVVAIDVGELLARLAHGGGVDDRQHLLEVLRDQPVVKGLVVVLDGTQVDVLVEVGLALLVLAIGPLHLLLDGLHVLGQQADQIELDALLTGEGAALVEQRHLQQRRSGVGDVEGTLGVGGHRLLSIGLTGTGRGRSAGAFSEHSTTPEITTPRQGRGAGQGESRYAKGDQQPLAAGAGLASPVKNSGRRRTPTKLPANAATSHTQPCRLPEAMPLK